MGRLAFSSAQGMDARASERGGRLARRNVASVLADVFGRVDVGVDARRRDGDADRVDRDDGPSGAGVEGSARSRRRRRIRRRGR